MSESTDDLTITPFFDSNLQSIHPAVGVAEGDHSKLAYVGVYVPCKVTDKEGHVTTRDFLYLITSEREKILALDKDLLARNWRLGYKPIHFETRWGLTDVQKFLNGEGVDIAQVYKDAIDVYKEFLEFSDDRFYMLNTLWSIGTYFHVLFNSFSYLYVGGIKRSGKTKTLMVHSVIDFNAIFSNNMSSSSLYRLIQNSKATLLIDESEKLSNPQRAQEFRNILLSGYKKGAKTFRCEKNAKDRIEPEAFEVYSPKMLGNIGGLEDVLEDRCITTFQRRSRNKVILNSEVDMTQGRYAKLRSTLYKLFLLHWSEVSEIYQGLKDSSELGELGEQSKTYPKGVNSSKDHQTSGVDALQNEIYEKTKGFSKQSQIYDRTKGFSELSVGCVDSKRYLEGSEYLVGRELELWKPLITIAMFFDKHLFAPTQPTQPTLTHMNPPDLQTVSTNAGINEDFNFKTLTTLTIELACDLAKLRHMENMTEVGEEILVQCLLDIVPDDQKVFWVKVKTVTTSMEEQFDSKQDWLSTIWVGRALRRLGFSDKRRVGAGIEYNIPSKAVLDLKARMQIEERKEEPKEPKEPEVKSCFLCNMALPVDHFNTTMMDGKEVHVGCFKQTREGLNQP